MRKGLLYTSCCSKLRFAFLMLSLMWVANASVVTTTADAGPGSLREALGFAPPASVITFAPDLSGSTIALTSGHLVISSSVTIDGSTLSSPVTISGLRRSRVFWIEAQASATLKSLKITAGDTGIYNSKEGGGGINALGALTLLNCEISDCTSHTGGGVFVFFGYDKPLRISRCKFMRNISVGGGAIESAGPVEILDSVFEDNDAMYGGAVNGNVVFVYRSKLARNGRGFAGGAISARNLTAQTCSFTGNIGQWGEGSAIHADRLVAKNCTFFRNRGAEEADAIFAFEAKIENCTFAEYGVIVGDGSVIVNATIQGTLQVRGEVALTNCFVAALSGTASGANNLINRNEDAQLLPLGDYGGPTQTMPPRKGSPLIDAGANNAPLTDQRGLARRGAPDIGAAEFDAVTIAEVLIENAAMSNDSFRLEIQSLAGMSFAVYESETAEGPAADWHCVGFSLENPIGSGKHIFQRDRFSGRRFFQANFP